MRYDIDIWARERPSELNIMTLRLYEYRYKLIQQHATSDKYGKCQICGKFVTDVYHQMAEQRFSIDGILDDDGGSWSHKHGAFGHKECLIGVRKEAMI